ncbi:MAG: ATP-dependent Clp protease ATP-binding subunit [Candidatus Omnitrophica bacterium]|nr:ATP-dependent Clp protease ATP-binding subunit [Candidatus Omnitrophota bacterium]
MFSRFTERARKVILLAKEEAKRLNHDYIGTEHILLGLVREGEGVAAAVLEGLLGISLETVRLEVEKLIKPGSDLLVSGDIPFTPKAKEVLELAFDEAKKMGHNYIGTEHLLLGLLREKEGIGAQVLLNLGLDINKLREAIMRLLGEGVPSGEPDSESRRGRTKEKSRTPALDAFGRDLTSLAKEGKLDPVIGRVNEIERVIQILARRTKNNPVLLGEAGVGKTAIVEGLAQKIVEGSVPEVLLDKRIVILDLGLIVAGTKYRGQFEERIKAVMQEIRRTKNVIIFIDELHTLVGAGGAEGALDASNILKPALSRGEIQCIGATTLNEYRKYIEKDAALERRFQTITVDPPTIEETIEILKGLRPKYEAFHKVKMSDEALEAAAKLSDRYISGKFLPDKAIDLIDEAGSRARLSATVVPPNFKNLKQKIERLDKQKKEAVSNQDFEKAAEIRDLERKAKEELAEKEKNWKQRRGEKKITLGREDIARVVSQITNIPLAQLEEKETKRLLQMEKEIHKRVVGQDEAVRAIAQAVRRSKAGIKDPRRPIGSFIFLGPTGVGKTLLARVLAEFMFGHEDAMFQIDMSEYMEKFNVSRLIGAPPGYVGYEEGGQLTEKVRRKPYSVVLLDEIEKAHPDVFNLLLQILEDGSLTDSFGRKVDFRNVILIMTSNVGTEMLKKKGTIGFSAPEEDASYETMKRKVLDAAKKVFRPEFLNRIDEMVVFHSLTKEDLKKIVDLQIEEVQERLSEKQLNIRLTSSAKEFLIEKGYDPLLGARPLRRTIQRYLEDPLSEEILAGRFKGKKTVEVSLKNGRLVFG